MLFRSGIGSNGQEVSGLISSVKWNGYTIQVNIGDELINMENIIEVREAGTVSIPNSEPEEIFSNESNNTDNSDLIDETGLAG